jgi:hypothetical protein
VPSRTTARAPRDSWARLTQLMLPVVAAGALALSLLAAPSAPVGSVMPVRLVADARQSATYTTFTLNVLHDLGPLKAEEDIRRAMALGDVGGFQEMSDLEDRQTIMRVAQELNYGWYMPVNGGGGAIPIVWNRNRFLMIDGRSVMVHPGEEGVTPARFINVVRLRELATGKVFGFINTHTLSGASFDAQATDMHLIPRLRLHLRMLHDEILGLAGSTEHVFVGGDLNVNYLADRHRRVEGLPTSALGDVINFDMPLQGSRGPTSLLDYGMSLKHGSGLVLDRSEIVGGFNSDHDAVRLTYTPIDLFEQGPLFNAPHGTAEQKSAVLDRMARAVMDVEPGATVRLASSRLADPALKKALLAAYAEGVGVQVVLDGSSSTGAERALEATLGTDVAAPSWVRRCVETCLAGPGTTATNFMLVSRAGGTTDLTIIGSGAAAGTSTHQWSDAFRVANPAIYAGYTSFFWRLARDTVDATHTRTLSFGRFTAQIYPVKPGKSHDPVLRALAPVGCKNARGIHTGDGRTNVRVAVRRWSGYRGQAIVDRLGVLKSRGCDVAVVAGPKVLKGVRRGLYKAGIPVSRAATGQSLLVVDGRYGDKAGAHYAWLGGPSWTDGALNGDGITLRVPYEETVRAYLKAFSLMWQRG